MAHKIQIKRGNKADLPTLDAGEFGLCQDTNELFIGNNGNQKIFPPTAPTISDVEGLQTALDNKVDNSRVLTNVPANAKFTDTTYSEISTSEIDAGTASTLRTITGRRVKYILDKVQGWIDSVTKADIGLGNVDNVKQASKTEFDTHNNDNTKHITNTERNNWNNKAEISDIPTKVSELTNDSGFLTSVTKSDVGLSNVDNVKQATKVEFDEHLAEEATESEYGHVRLSDLPKGKRVARFVIGTSTAGWTAADCDYLCDGTNDQEEIIQALNALPATGGEVVILDGTYNITASIDVPKNNVSIRGSGNATTLKRMYNSTNADSGSTAKGLITLNEKSGCKIQGLQIDGNKATYSASYNHGIYLTSSSNNTVTGNTCNNNTNSSISLTSSSNNTVTGNTCNNNTNYGIYLTSSSNNTVTGNTCNNNTNSSISLTSSSNNTVTGNTCNNNTYGIYLTSSSNNTVTGNTCNNNSNGILLFSSRNNTVTGNTCIRGTGQTSDYASNQHTIRLQGTANNYNLIAANNCMGKAVVIEGGTGNSAWGNKYDSGDDLPI